MVTNGKKYTTQLETKSFTGNKEYTYHLKTFEKTPGIITAEDWIAFSQLINSNTFTQYKGKTLDDFGETMNGITIYYSPSNAAPPVSSYFGATGSGRSWRPR